MDSPNRFLVVGRAGMDLYAYPNNTHVENSPMFKSSLGGSAANIAVAMSRQHCQVNLLSCVSDDCIGRFTLNELNKYDINVEYVTTLKDESRTSLAITETRFDQPQCVIYRNNAADLQLSTKHVENVDYKKFTHIIITGTALSLEPSRIAVLQLIQRAQFDKIKIIFDLDFRAYSWLNKNQAAEIYLEVAKKSTLIIGNEQEFQIMTDEQGSSEKLARSLSDNRLVIYKMGEKGCITYESGKSTYYDIFKTQAIKPMGAGDAFLGVFCASMDNDFSISEAIKRASAAAAIVVSQFGCAPAMPTTSQLQDFLDNY